MDYASYLGHRTNRIDRCSRIAENTRITHLSGLLSLAGQTNDNRCSRWKSIWQNTPWQCHPSDMLRWTTVRASDILLITTGERPCTLWHLAQLGITHLTRDVVDTWSDNIKGGHFHDCHSLKYKLPVMLDYCCIIFYPTKFYKISKCFVD